MDELDQFEILLNHGLDMKVMIEICFKNHKKILDKLNQGASFIQAICENQKEPIFKIIQFLSQDLSLKDAIACAKDMNKNSYGFIDTLLKESAYSIFIVVFSYAMILFFSKSIMPSMLVYSSNDSLFVILQILRIFYSILFGIVLIFVLIWILILKVPLFFLKCIEKWRIPSYKSYITLQFSILFHALIKRGFSTKHAIQTISSIQSSFKTKYIARDLLNSLNQGRSWQMAMASCKFLDVRFLDFMKMAEMSSNLEGMLDMYESFQRTNLEKIKKKVIRSIQIFSYITVGILVILVYQIMLYPLNMLSGF